jgi:hypothetical protein
MPVIGRRHCDSRQTQARSHKSSDRKHVLLQGREIRFTHGALGEGGTDAAILRFRASARPDLGVLETRGGSTPVAVSPPAHTEITRQG